jgi:hypothetical protein
MSGLGRSTTAIAPISVIDDVLTIARGRQVGGESVTAIPVTSPSAAQPVPGASTSPRAGSTGLIRWRRPAVAG